MINAEEHFYSEDPNQGHPDVRTRLKDVRYFFLGNGKIQAAVQICGSGEGTPVGLILMDPEKLQKKRDSLLFDPDSGLENTMISITSENREFKPPGKKMDASWCFDCDYPMVSITWETSTFKVTEWFYCRNATEYTLVRKVKVHNIASQIISLQCQTGIPGYLQSHDMMLDAGESAEWCLLYDAKPGEKPAIRQHTQPEINENLTYWNNRVRLTCHSQIPDQLFKASSFQLPAVISENAVVDASIWQYNREWVRDHSMMILGLILTGHFEKANKLLRRLLSEFVSSEGGTVDSSLTRSNDEVELDQNGELLYALEQYYLWSGDKQIVKDNWDSIVALAEFPLKEVFRHPQSGLLSNRRDFWERHHLHGILSGIELTTQLFVSIGLTSASNLAGILGRDGKEKNWKKESDRIKNAMLDDSGSGLIHQGKLIKRRNNDGSVQDRIIPLSEASLPQEVPLARDCDHLLNPDSCTALPIAFGLVPADSPVARLTMQDLEILWNQDWNDGGYGRYHISSEPDSPGSWPFPSLYIARAYAEMNQYDRVWRILNWLYDLPGGKAGSWFENYGERISPPFPQVGIPPWTWGEMILLFVNHIIGLRPGYDQIHITPRLLTGLKKVEASFPFRGNRLFLTIERKNISNPAFKSNVNMIKTWKTGAIFTIEDRDMYIEGLIPN